MIELPPLASAPRRSHFEASHGTHRAIVLASTTTQVRRYFAKAWDVQPKLIKVISRIDLNHEGKFNG